MMRKKKKNNRSIFMVKGLDVLSGTKQELVDTLSDI